MNVFLDTNIWLRYFIGDEKDHLEVVQEIFKNNDEGKLRIATSTFVLSEFIYTERSFYKISKVSVVEDLEAIQMVRGIWIIEHTDFPSSFQLFKKSQANKWSDCVIVSQVPEDYIFCSFDEGLEKLIWRERFVSPDKVIP